MFGMTGGLVLLAAVLHASWNALLHGNPDRALSMTWMSMAIALVATIVVTQVPLPSAAAWPYIIASGLVHNVYNLALIQSYKRGDLGQAYPIARGTSPLLVALGAALFAGEHIHPLHAFGVLLVSAGIIALALQRSHTSRTGIVIALVTGATIALYTVIDGIGVRHTDGQAVAYTAWMFVFYWAMPVWFIATRGARALWSPVRTNPASIGASIGGGLLSIAAYGIVIWALQSDAMGGVSALRETSVVFAVLIGRVALKESVSAMRWAACTVVTAGAICLGV
ncbi:DMT family transporter [Cupriavidus plantarum]|uniref:DMT family transporter n=1 Tax=Cupriavidus plantarum TaxID=942865 RepID=UPI001B12FAC2|nr:DMT family transporter [Cupriavidus plantarum]CAG2127988.1 hypothetical protein LMG26296_01034 [Cupriavidus plantarum]SMR66834.1 Uncharacterized membrane protein [Cupriavidus plantarum]